MEKGDMTDDLILLVEIIGTVVVVAVICLLAWRMLRRQPP
jgi:hypothetical protein